MHTLKKKHTVGSLVVQLQMLFTPRYQMGICSFLIFVVLQMCIRFPNSRVVENFFVTFVDFYVCLFDLRLGKSNKT